MDRMTLKKAIEEKIQLPVIPDRTWSVLDFGAVPDGDGIQTKQLQSAIDAANKAGGGKVVVPAGRYRTGALRLKSNVELHLESADTELAFVSEDPELHYPVVFCHWEATPCYNYSPLIYACDAHDIAVTGRGVLDGGADREHWWNWHHQVEEAWSLDKPDLQQADRKLLRSMNVNGVPVKERVFGPGHYLRPNFVQPVRCRRVLIQGVTLKHTPMWQLNPVMCESLTVDGVTMSSHGPNNDGCDPESCSGVHIVNCRFDTGDDCISLKSGRDRDGREANMPCEYVLIEHNEFADGHGGIAMGSEMSGGIRCVLAENNRFSSPNLTYALRLKTNARRGGRVEDIVLADSVMEHVHGAAVHGTMLYEDGRNGDDLPVFRNITIENITAHGGDYGIFLEAFDEVPITGLVLRNITIDGVAQRMRCMNWEKPVVEHVTINGKRFPRPGKVRIPEIPQAGETVTALADYCGGENSCRYFWEMAGADRVWKEAGEGERFTVPEAASWLRVTARDADGNEEKSRAYRVLETVNFTDSGSDAAGCSSAPGSAGDFGSADGNEVSGAAFRDTPLYISRRLFCRGLSCAGAAGMEERPVTRAQLAKMLFPLAVNADDNGSLAKVGEETSAERANSELSPAFQADPLKIVIEKGFLAPAKDGTACPDGYVTRQEMATVAMQACGVNYRNASSTMPVCRDVDQVSNNYGTNVARALYFGFMDLEPDGRCLPNQPVTGKEAARMINRVADFAGL